MLTAAEAAEIARARARELGWGLLEPVGIIVERKWMGIFRSKSAGEVVSFEVISDPAMLGTRSRFKIDAQTGKILREGYIPR